MSSQDLMTMLEGMEVDLAKEKWRIEETYSYACEAIGLQRIKKLTDRIIFQFSKKKKRRQINISLVFLFINT